MLRKNQKSGFGVRNMIVWNKGTPGMGVGWRMQHELIMAAVNVSQPFDPKKTQGNVLDCPRTGNDEHPTQTLVDLLAMILDVTDMVQKREPRHVDTMKAISSAL